MDNGIRTGGGGNMMLLGADGMLVTNGIIREREREWAPMNRSPCFDQGHVWEVQGICSVGMCLRLSVLGDIGHWQ